MSKPFLHSEIVTEDLENGHFHCPNCVEQKDFSLRRPRRYLMASRLRVCELEPLDIQVHCRGCEGSWGKEVLQQDPAQKERKWHDDYFFACLDCWLETALADGDFSPREMEAFTRVAKDDMSWDLDPDKIRERAHKLRELPNLSGYYLDRILARVSDVGRECILRGAWKISNADGAPTEAVKAHLVKLAEDLRMSDVHVMGLRVALQIGPFETGTLGSTERRAVRGDLPGHCKSIEGG